MKNILRFCIMFTLSLLWVACQPQQFHTVPFAELVGAPFRYNGQLVCTEGVHLQGFETNSLGASTYELDGFLYLTEPVIWVEGAGLEIQGECTQAQGNSFCLATVCGKFESDGGYGHLGGYSYQITGSD